MPNALAFACPSDTRECDGWFELAYESDGIHPVTKKPFKLSKDMFEGWVKHFSFVKQKEGFIPLVKNHSCDPTDRLGKLLELEVRGPDDFRKGHSVWMKREFASPELKDTLKNCSYSVFREEDRTEFTGDYFPHAIMHIGVTDYPVLKGLREQRELALSSIIFGKDVEEFSIIEKTSEGDKMTPEIKKALGLSEDADEAAVMSAISVLKTSGDQSQQFAQVIANDRKARVEKLSFLKDEQKTELLKFCTVESVSDKASTSLFDMAMSALSIAGNQQQRQEEDEEEENFQTGHQFGNNPEGKAKSMSLIDCAKQKQEQAKARGDKFSIV